MTKNLKFVKFQVSKGSRASQTCSQAISKRKPVKPAPLTISFMPLCSTTSGKLAYRRISITKSARPLKCH